jgi:hypothetical protein
VPAAEPESKETELIDPKESSSSLKVAVMTTDGSETYTASTTAASTEGSVKASAEMLTPKAAGPGEVAKATKEPVKDAAQSSSTTSFWVLPKGLILCCLITVAALESNPGKTVEGFKSHLRSQFELPMAPKFKLPLAHRAAESFGLIKVHLWDYKVAAVGRQDLHQDESSAFVGLFGCWLKLPSPVYVQIKTAADLSAGAIQEQDLIAALVLVPIVVIVGSVALNYVSLGWDCGYLGHFITKLLFLYPVAAQIPTVMSESMFVLVLLLGACFATVGCLLWSIFVEQEPVTLDGLLACLNLSGPLTALIVYMYMARPESPFTWLGHDTFLGPNLSQNTQFAEFLALQVFLGADSTLAFVAHFMGVAAGWFATEYISQACM